MACLIPRWFHGRSRFMGAPEQLVSRNRRTLRTPTQPLVTVAESLTKRYSKRLCMHQLLARDGHGGIRQIECANEVFLRTWFMELYRSVQSNDIKFK